jgi:hypothetical protein
LWALHQRDHACGQVGQVDADKFTMAKTLSRVGSKAIAPTAGVHHGSARPPKPVPMHAKKRDKRVTGSHNGNS